MIDYATESYCSRKETRRIRIDNSIVTFAEAPSFERSDLNILGTCEELGYDFEDIFFWNQVSSVLFKKSESDASVR